MRHAAAIVLGLACAALAAVLLAPAADAAEASWAISATAYEFAPQLMQTGPSAPAYLVVTNTGETTLGAPQVEVGSFFYLKEEGEPPARFSALSACGPIPPGGECAIAARFEALAPGPREVTLAIRDREVAPFTVQLRGVGLGPIVNWSPYDLFLDSRVLGTELNPPGVLTVTNTGSADLKISGFAFAGVGKNPNGFKVVGGTCGSGNPVPIGGSCTVQVSYTPTQLGIQTAELVIHENGVHGYEAVQVVGAGSPPVSESDPPGSLKTFISAMPAAKLRRRWAKFRFAVSGADPTLAVAQPAFVCRLDGAPYRPCGSPRTYRHLHPGRHVFRVRPETPGGTLSGKPAVWRFRVLPREVHRVRAGHRRAARG